MKSDAITEGFDPLAPLPLRELRLDLTTRCNLRCVYCPVSLPGHTGHDMAVENLSQALGWIRDMAAQGNFMVSVNGVGETTFMAGWMDVCRSLLALGLSVQMTCNLAKEYTSEELEVLSGLTRIAVSIDTADRDLLQRLRRKVDVRQIVWNIMAIRAQAVRHDKPMPCIEFLCGLYDRNSLQVGSLAELAITLSIPRVTFWDLYVHPGTPAAAVGPDHVRALIELGPTELTPRLAAIDAACALLERNGIEVCVPGGFLQELRTKERAFA